MTDERIRSKRTSQTAVVAELIDGQDGKGHRETALRVKALKGIPTN